MKKKIIFAILIITIVFICCSCSIATEFKPSNRKEIDLSKLENNSVGMLVANNCVNACVRIETQYSGGYTSAGAGFIITSDGYVVTNRHVVQQYISGSDLPRNLTDLKRSVINIKVVFDSSDYFEANIVEVSEEPTIDVAILKIKAKGISFSYLTLDNSSNLNYGQTVYTFGNPSNIGLAFAEGKIANPSISFKSTIANGTSVTYTGIILLDANVNHGNSGGALLSNKGNVIGIVYGRIETGDNNVNDVYGLGLAIPTSKIIKIIKKSSEASKIKYTLFEQSNNNQEDQNENQEGQENQVEEETE